MRRSLPKPRFRTTATGGRKMAIRIKTNLFTILELRSCGNATPHGVPPRPHKLNRAGRGEQGPTDPKPTNVTASCRPSARSGLPALTEITSLSATFRELDSLKSLTVPLLAQPPGSCCHELDLRHVRVPSKHSLRSRRSGAGSRLGNARAADAGAAIALGGDVQQLDGHGKHHGVGGRRSQTVDGLQGA